MKNNKIKEIKTLVETKFVGLFEVKYKNKLGNDRTWMVASRKSKEELGEIYLNDKEGEIDAVVIAAYHKGYDKLVLIKQFRVPINDYVIEIPAGLVDGKENFEDAVRRELKEETGLDLVEIDKENTKEKVYASVGVTDESVALVKCTCDGVVSTDNLEDDEDLEVILVSKEEAKKLIKSNVKIDVKSYLALQNFIMED